MTNIIFVVDNNIFSLIFKNLYFDIFTDVYEPWSKGMKDGYIISVDEVYRELEQFYFMPKMNNSDEIIKVNWLKEHKQAFQNMTFDESNILKKIYLNNKFCEDVKEKNILEGKPHADAILVAKAKCVKGIIVTNESSSKPNSGKIPNICVSQDVPYINLHDFYKVLKINLYNNKPALEGIILRRTLD
jgi:hypothetical protein